jgi:transposase
MGRLFRLNDEAWAAIEPHLDRCFGPPSGHPAHTWQRQRHPHADELIEAVGPVRRLIADRGYDANRLRRVLRSVGTVSIIPGRSRKRPIRHDERR